MVNGSFNFSGQDSIVFLICAFGCVCCAAMAAGMTIGLLSLDTLKLKIKQTVGTAEEKKAANTILPILENHHWLMCTLLLFNAGANEALPIFLDDLVPSWCAVIISVTLVLICGEVIPTAIFSGPHQLSIAAKFTPFVYCLRALLSPIAYPMSKVLDCVLGIEEEDDTFNRDEMGAMVNIIREEQSKAREHAKKKKQQQFNDSQAKQPKGPIRDFFRKPASTTIATDAQSVAMSSEAPEDELTGAEINVITGVLGLSKIKVRDICIPMSEVNMLSTDQILTPEVISAIDKVGHSRLPVFKGSNINDIVGFFIVKKLMNVNPEKNVPLSTFSLNAPIVVGANISVLDAMKIFQQSATHLALVSDDPVALRASIAAGTAPKGSAAPIGIITIEDIFEAMLQEEIEDETDIALRDSRMSAASSLREMSMSMSSRPSAIGISTNHLHSQPMSAQASSHPSSGNDSEVIGFGVERTHSTAGPTTTMPKAIRPVLIQSATKDVTKDSATDVSLQGKSNSVAIDSKAGDSKLTDPLLDSTNPLLSQLKPSTYNKFHHKIPQRRGSKAATSKDGASSLHSGVELTNSVDMPSGNNFHRHLEEGLLPQRASSLDSITGIKLDLTGSTTQSLLRTKGLTGSMLARHLGVVKNQRLQERSSSDAQSDH